MLSFTAYAVLCKVIAGGEKASAHTDSSWEVLWKKKKKERESKDEINKNTVKGQIRSRETEVDTEIQKKK